MKVLNTKNISLEQLLPALQQHYPTATLQPKKMLRPAFIKLTSEGIRYGIQPTRTHFILSVQPPVLWAVVGAIITWIPVLIATIALSGQVRLGGAIQGAAIGAGLWLASFVYKKKKAKEVDPFLANCKELIQQ